MPFRRRQEELLGLDTTIKNTPPSAEVLNGGGEPLQQQTPQPSDTIGTRSRRTSLRKSESLAVSKAPINQGSNRQTNKTFNSKCCLAQKNNLLNIIDVETTMVKKKTLESVVSVPVTQTEASLQAAKKDVKPTTSVVQSLRKTTRYLMTVIFASKKVPIVIIWSTFFMIKLVQVKIDNLKST